MNEKRLDVIKARIAVAEVERLRAALEEIRDLARTGSMPNSYGYTEEQWNWYKINRIAGLASDALKGSE
jgi:hypothetical protein